MHRRRLLAVSSALIAGALAGCTSGSNGEDDPGTESGDSENGDTEPDDPERVEPAVDDEQLAALVGSTNAFAFDLYRELLEENSDENLFSSPVSISIALGMTYAGARGDTREQMHDTLRFALDDDELHEAFNELQQEFAARGEEFDPDDEPGGGYDEDDEPVPFELSIANSLWGQEGYPFDEGFLERIENHYGTGLQSVDYQSEPAAAREKINDWVAEETEERIDELLPEGSLDALTRLVLVNAVYFFANWKHPFQESNTSQEEFTALDGSTEIVPMMSKDRSWSYAELDGAQAVELPYVGDETSMVVVLPPEGEFESYERAFDTETLATLLDAMESRDGTVSLPRFEFESGFQLGVPLQELGMVDAFVEEEANFDGLVDSSEVDAELLIDEVYHDSFVAVDEEGTEAAAATGVVVRDESAPADPFDFVADRPFLFAIRDEPTETILFFGRAVDPAGWE